MLDEIVLNRIIFAITFVVAFLYSGIATCYLLKKDYAWCLVWLSYALANVGLILIGLRNDNNEEQEQQKVHQETREEETVKASESNE